MARRRVAVKRTVLPDQQFNSTLVSKFINSLMERGKKSTAEGIFYGSMEVAKAKVAAEQDATAAEQPDHVRVPGVLCQLCPRGAAVDDQLDPFLLQALPDPIGDRLPVQVDECHLLTIPDLCHPFSFDRRPHAEREAYDDRSDR